MKECKTCNGRGFIWVKTRQLGFPPNWGHYEEKCPDCKGHQYI